MEERNEVNGELEDFKLRSVTIENFLKVKFANINFENDIVVIGGENGQGKSSVAKALLMAFAGKKAVPSKPVRNGAVEGRVYVELDGDLILEAIVQPDRSISLELRDKKGAIYRRPMERLSEFNFHYGYYPQEFIEMDAKKQVEMLMTLAGLDFAEMECEYKSRYQERTDVNRQVAQAEALLNSTPRFHDAPEKETPVSELTDELEAAHSALALKNELTTESQKLRNTAGLYRQKIEELKQAIKVLEDDAATHEARSDMRLVEAQGVAVPDIDAIRTKLAGLDEANAKVRANQKWEQYEKQVAELQGKTTTLTARLNEIVAEKENRIRSATFPVDGLGFDENGVTLDGFPFEQASDAEQWKAAIAIGFAMKPKLKLVYVRNGSMLTPKTRKLVYDLTREAGGQLLFEIAGDAEDVSVVMEDGLVKEDRTQREPEIRLASGEELASSEGR